MAQLKNTTISDTGSINLPVGTTAQRPTSAAGGQIRYNTDINDTEYYDGGAWRPISDSNPEATGGTIVDTDIGGVPYRIHLFTNTGNSTFTVSRGGEIEYLIVAGGGAGGHTSPFNPSGGGGAGEFLTGIIEISPGSYPITVGAGGIASTTVSVSGNNTTLGSILTARGGGGGGGGGAAGQAGGSGGGSGRGATGGISTAVAPGIGNAGGSSAGTFATTSGGGGGGGASETGKNSAVDPPINQSGGRAGNGIYSNLTGIGQFYAGGGGGGGRDDLLVGPEGLGGGGRGIRRFAETVDFLNGTGKNNTGGGGGGRSETGDFSNIGGNGGSGIVVIRYRRNQTLTANPNKTIVSSIPGVTSPNRSEMFLFLDPGNPVCFTPGNTVCHNLITGGPVTGAAGEPGSGSHTPNPANFPVYNSINGGVFDFIEGVGRGMNCEEDLGTRTELTFTMWFYKKGTGGPYFSDARNDGGQWFLSNYQSRNITYTHALAYNFNGPTTDDYLADGPNFNDRWYHMAVVSNTSESKLYLNGIEVDQYVNNTPINMTFGKNFRIGNRFNTTGQWTGYMGLIYAHNRVLSPVEIYQSFTADRGRYGV